jgi:hypothetical protein
VIAFIPGSIGLILATFKPDGRASWYYRRYHALFALRYRLLFELPENPSPDNVAAISAARSALDEKMQKEWDETFALTAGAIVGKRKEQ